MDRNRTNLQHSQRLIHQPPSAWFQGCPLSKFIAFSTVLVHLILENGGFSGGTDLLSLNLEDIMVNGEIHRLLLSTLTFRTTGELVSGMMLMVPLMKQFEREFGTKKFGAFLLVKCMLLTTMFQLLALVVIDGFIHTNGQYTTYLAPGPYPFIGALLYLYHVYTPRLYTKFIGVLGFDFSEKVMTYVLSLIVMYSQGLASIIPAFCGFVAAGISISKSNVYGSWQCELPPFINNIAINIGKIFGLNQLVTTTTLMSRSGTTAPNTRGGNRYARPNPGRRGQQQQHHQPPPPPQFQPMPQPQPPSPEAIEQLTAMGFERDAVVRALGATDNNVEAAANRLLSGI